MRSPARLILTAAAIAVLSLTLGTSSVCADDPQPTNPTLLPVGGGSTQPTAADWDTWWNVIIPGLQAAFPEATYEELCAIGLEWWYLLPPEAPPESGGDSSDALLPLVE